MLKVVYVFLLPIEGEHVAVNAAYLFECLPTVAPLWLDSESALVIWAHEPLGRGSARLLMKLSVFLRSLIGLFGLFLFGKIRLRCLHIYTRMVGSYGRGLEELEHGCVGQGRLTFLREC